MKVKLPFPIIAASGKVAGLKAGYYARTNRKTGRTTLVRIVNPFDRHPPTPAQLAQRARFAEMARLPRRKRRSADGTN